MTTRESHARAPWSAIACDGTCLLFASWTVLCNVAVLCGASLRVLLAAAASGVLALVCFEVVTRPSRGPSPLRGLLASAAFASNAGKEASAADDTRMRIAMGALAVVLVVASNRFGLALLWVGGLALVALASVIAARSAPDAIEASANSRHEVVLWIVAVGSAVLTSVVHRPDMDEPFYLNLAAAAADFPTASLLRADSFHGLSDVALPSYYRVHAIELLSGAISYLLGIEPVTVAHVLIAGVAGLLLPLALARALRILTLDAWPWAVLAVLAVYALDGSEHRGYGNFAFVRLYQGKAIFVSVMIPLIIAYGIECGLAPSRRTFARLAAAQIGSIGLTSTALWCAPLVACVSVMAVLRPRMSDLRAMAMGIASTAWVIAMGLLVRREITPRTTSSGHVAFAMGMDRDLSLGVQTANAVLGESQVVLAYALLLFLACVLGRTAIARRVACLFALVFLAILINPELSHHIAAGITGLSTYWRVFWALPLPLIAAVALVAPVPAAAGDRKRAWGVGAAATLAASFLAIVPARTSIAADNGVRLDWPGPKVPPEYAVAREIVRHVTAHSTVLAPPKVSMWLPTFRHYVYPVLAKPQWLQHSAQREAREALVWCIQGVYLYDFRGAPTRRCASPLLDGALDRVGVDAVALPERESQRSEIRARLWASGFAPQASRIFELELWTHRR